VIIKTYIFICPVLKAIGIQMGTNCAPLHADLLSNMLMRVTSQE